LFYQRLLEAHPELAPMFNKEDQGNGAQAKRLAAAILAYVGNLDRLDLLGPAVTNISKRHVQTNVKPEHYPIVGHFLLDAMSSVLGEALTPELLEAWKVAYTELADMMMGREAAMYGHRGPQTTSIG
jgi:nitric oxide dioxygenase